MIVFRLVHDTALKNNPPFQPARTTNRWNTDQVIVAYASESLALSAMEMLTYWGRYANLRGYEIFTYSLGERDVEDQLEHTPKLDHRSRPATQQHGDVWAESRRSLALRVPSVVLPASFNYLINPDHPDFSTDNITHLGPFEFDARIESLIQAARQNRRRDH